jgi:signal peptide peptidase SppA
MKTIFWAGSSDSFEQVLQAQAKVEAMQAKPDMKAGWIEDMVAKLPPMWRHEGDTAVVEIDGPVVQGEAGFLRLFGVVGYADIAKAAIEAAQHKDTKSMLYHINSPGGDVAGIVDMTATLETLSRLKPSRVHTSELMASAGYWMASAIKGEMSAGPTAIVGSIGVLRVHSENSKAMEMRGVTATVLRSGEFKAELNSVEPLTDGAKERAVAQLQEIHTMFRAQVAKGRPNLTAEKLAEVTEGQTFLGKQAVKAGLVDKVQSFGLALKLLDTRKQSGNTPSNSKGKAMHLTPEIVAAIAAGASLASLGLNADCTPMSAEQIEARDAAAKAEADAAEAARVQAEADAADAAAKASAGAELTGVKAELAVANAKIADLEKIAAHHDGLVAVVRDVTANMLVPMGGSKAAVESLDATALLTEHTRVKAEFTAKFPVGRVSQSEGADKKTKAAAPVGFLLATQQFASTNR